MANELLPKGMVIPEHILRRSGTSVFGNEGLSGGLGGGADFGPRISLKGGRFRIVDGDSETVLDSTTLNVIIVGRNPVSTKQFYAKAWSPDAEPTAPNCFSLDGVRPDDESENKQSDLCANCPQNAWGSKVTPAGQKIKACSDEKRIAVVSAEAPDGPIYLLRVTGGSFKALREYDTVLRQHGLIAEGVVTKVSFDTDASFPRLIFAVGGFVDDDVLDNTIIPIAGGDQVKITTGEAHVSPSSGGGHKALAKPKPTLVQVEDKREPKVEKKAEPKAEPEPKAEKTATGFGSGTKVEAKEESKASPSTEPSTAKTAPASASQSDLEAQIAAMLEGGEDDEDGSSD